MPDPRPCHFTHPNGSPCGSPAVRGKGLCYSHVLQQKRQRNIARANAEKPFIQQRRAQRAQQRARELRDYNDLRARQIIAANLPDLVDYDSLGATLDSTLHSYASGCIDATTARAILLALRLSSTLLRSMAYENGASKATVKRIGKDFEVRVIQAIQRMKVEQQMDILLGRKGLARGG